MDGGGEVGDRTVWEFGMDMSTALGLKWMIDRDLLYSSSRSSQSSVAAWGRGVWERTGTGRRVAEPCHCSPETITILLISYTPIQNLKV